MQAQKHHQNIWRTRVANHLLLYWLRRSHETPTADPFRPRTFAPRLEASGKRCPVQSGARPMLRCRDPGAIVPPGRHRARRRKGAVLILGENICGLAEILAWRRWGRVDEKHGNTRGEAHKLLILLLRQAKDLLPATCFFGCNLCTMTHDTC